MNRFLSGKQALVTGATRGIGRAVAEALGRAGAGVAICGRNQDSVDRAVEEIRAASGARIVGRSANVGNEEEVALLFEFVDEQLGGLDILVNNAGVGIFGAVARLPTADWRQVIDTNLTGAFLCSREALRRFGNREGGYIVNISSLAGKNPFATGGAYNASKFGLDGFSEAMMLDHRHEKVRVTTIAPGSVATEFRPGGTMEGADWKVAPEDIAELVLTVLRMPERTMVSRMEVRPSRPRK